MEISEKIFSDTDADRRFRIVSEIENARAATLAKATAMMKEWDEGDMPEASQLKFRSFVPSDQEVKKAYAKSTSGTSLQYSMFGVLLFLTIPAAALLWLSCTLQLPPGMNHLVAVIIHIVPVFFGAILSGGLLFLMFKQYEEIKAIHNIRKLYGSADYDEWFHFLREASTVYLCGNEAIFVAQQYADKTECKAIFYDAIHRIIKNEDKDVPSVMYGRDGSMITTVPDLQCLAWTPEDAKFKDGIGEMIALVNTMVDIQIKHWGDTAGD